MDPYRIKNIDTNLSPARSLVKEGSIPTKVKLKAGIDSCPNHHSYLNVVQEMLLNAIR